MLGLVVLLAHLLAYSFSLPRSYWTCKATDVKEMKAFEGCELELLSPGVEGRSEAWRLLNGRV